MQNRFFPEIRGNFGFGCMNLPMKGEEINGRQFRNMADAFLDAGFNFFETSHVYLGGRSETAFRDCVAGRHPRDRFLLAEKMTECFVMKEKDVLPFFEKQLEWCGVDYFDFYILDDQNKETYPIFKELNAYEIIYGLRKEGRIRRFGISFHDNPEMLDIILTEHPEIEFVEITFNYLDYGDSKISARSIYSVCEKHGKPVIAMSPLKGGQLADLPEEAGGIFRSLNGGSQVDYALRYAGSFSNMALVLSGGTDPEHLKDNCAVMNGFQPLDRKEMDAVYDVCDALYSMTLIPCCYCRYCIEEVICPKSILIPDLFAAFNKQASFHNFNATYYYNNVITGPGHGKASDCVLCASCEKVCPEQLNIRQLLKMVADKFEREQ